jgi:hypothetical protein
MTPALVELTGGGTPLNGVIAPSKITNQHAHPIFAAGVLFIGLSAANAMGGILQLGFFTICLIVALVKRHRFPVFLMLQVMGCGLVAMLTSLRFEPSITPLILFLRPFVEGYLIAIFLYRVCGIRSLMPLMIALAGYVTLEFASALLMMALPGLRSAMLAGWYGSESYQGTAFQSALLFRGFGISRHHLFGMPLAIGTISSLLLVVASLQEHRAIRTGFGTAAFCGILLVILNARIGLVPVLACYVLGVSFFFRFYFLRQTVLMIGVVFPAVILLVRVYLGEASDAIFHWLIEGFFQFFHQANSSGTTTISDLSSMVILPKDGLSWLIGQGRVCQPGESCYSDIGWIRLLQEGGLLLATLVGSLYLSIIFRTRKRLLRQWEKLQSRRIQISTKLLLWVFVITFAAATIKGDAFAPNDYSRLLMMFVVWAYQAPFGYVRQHYTGSIQAPNILSG